jgi:hypothetical protein
VIMETHRGEFTWPNHPEVEESMFV